MAVFTTALLAAGLCLGSPQDSLQQKPLSDGYSPANAPSAMQIASSAAILRPQAFNFKYSYGGNSNNCWAFISIPNDAANSSPAEGGRFFFTLSGSQSSASGASIGAVHSARLPAGIAATVAASASLNFDFDKNSESLQLSASGVIGLSASEALILGVQFERNPSFYAEYFSGRLLTVPSSFSVKLSKNAASAGMELDFGFARPGLCITGWNEKTPSFSGFASIPLKAGGKPSAFFDVYGTYAKGFKPSHSVMVKIPVRR